MTKADGYLQVENAIQTVRNYITDHSHRLTYVTDKWMSWQEEKVSLFWNDQINASLVQPEETCHNC